MVEAKRIPCGDDKQERQQQRKKQIPFGDDKQICVINKICLG